MILELRALFGTQQNFKKLNRKDFFFRNKCRQQGVNCAETKTKNIWSNLGDVTSHVVMASAGSVPLNIVTNV